MPGTSPGMTSRCVPTGHIIGTQSSPLTLVSSSGHKAAAFVADSIFTKHIVAWPRRSFSTPISFTFLELDRRSDPACSVVYESNNRLHRTRSMHSRLRRRRKRRRRSCPQSSGFVVDTPGLSRDPRGRQTLWSVRRRAMGAQQGHFGSENRTGKAVPEVAGAAPTCSPERPPGLRWFARTIQRGQQPRDGAEPVARITLGRSACQRTG